MKIFIFDLQIVFSGEIVKDFQIRLTVTEDRPITGLNVHIPVIGELSNDLVEFTDTNTARIVFNMSEVEQVVQGSNFTLNTKLYSLYNFK